MFCIGLSHEYIFFSFLVAANTEATARAAVERGSASAANNLRAAITRHCEALCAAPPPLDHQHLAAMLRDTVRP